MEMVPLRNIEVHAYLLLQHDVKAQKGEKLEASWHAATVRLLRKSKTAILEDQSDLSFSAWVSILFNINLIRKTHSECHLFCVL